jgi:hypothetical protein
VRTEKSDFRVGCTVTSLVDYEISVPHRVIVKGMKARLTYWDAAMDVWTLESEAGTAFQVSTLDLLSFWETVDPKDNTGLPVPRSLMRWFKDTTPYIGKQNE